MRWARLLIGIATLAAWLGAACTTMPLGPSFLAPANLAPSSAAGSSSSPAHTGPLFPVGRFADIAKPNLLLLAVETDGRFRVLEDGRLMDSGRFTPAGSQVLVDSVKCTERKIKPALYVWAYDEDNDLDFDPVGTDPCWERQQYLGEQYEAQHLFVYELRQPAIAADWLP